ncbi:PAS domain S-box-containing protein [Pedobacter sp. UYEF25]
MDKDKQIAQLQIANTALASENAEKEKRIVKLVLKNKELSHQHSAYEKRESELNQFYQMLFNAPSAIGMLKGPNHVFEMANPLYLQMIGKTDIIGKTVAEVLPEIIEQGFVDILDHVYQCGEPYSGRATLVKLKKGRDGALNDVYMNFIYQPYRNEAGNITGVFFFLNDITEEIKSKKEIEKSERFFKGVIENSADMVAMMNAAGNTIYASPALYKKFGYSKKEILGLKVLDVVHPDDFEKMAVFIEKLLSRPGVSLISPLVRERKKDGNYIWVEGTLTNFMETEGINAMVANFRDVTERINAESKIRDSEFRYRQIVETAQEGIWLLDEHNKTTFVNKKMCEILQYKEEEMLGKENFYFMDSAGKEKAAFALERRKMGIAEKIELNYISKLGKLVITEVSATPVFDEHGVFKGALGMISDISGKKNLEDLLEKSNRLARIGSWEIDVLKGTVFWSDITKEIREAEPDFIPDLSTGIGFFTPGVSKDIIAQRVQQCIDKGISWDEELQLKTFKGNLRWVRTIGEAVFVNGKCNKIYGSFQDITERKIAAEKISRSEEKLKLAQLIAQVGSWEIDMMTNAHSWSAEFYRILGISENVVPSHKVFMSIIHPDDSPTVNKTLKNAFSTHADSSFNFRFRKENGEIGYASSEWKYEFDSSQNPLYIHGILRDLTEQKKAECERAKMTADIIQRNINLEQFTFIVSHNLRAPAANIIGCTKLLQDETTTLLEQKELLNGLYKSVTTLDAVIKDINNILQVKSEVDEKKEIILFSALTKEITTGMGGAIAKNRARIVTDFSEVNEIYSLKIYLYSIFYNLIGNSIKYAKENEPPIIEIKSNKENGKIVLTFKDNGLGVDMDTQGCKIFGLYSRFHSHVEGKGMGLFIVKAQVESLGGTITVASEINRGTEFTVVFDDQK